MGRAVLTASPWFVLSLTQQQPVAWSSPGLQLQASWLDLFAKGKVKLKKIKGSGKQLKKCLTSALQGCALELVLPIYQP